MLCKKTGSKYFIYLYELRLKPRVGTQIEKYIKILCSEKIKRMQLKNRRGKGKKKKSRMRLITVVYYKGVRGYHLKWKDQMERLGKKKDTN